MTLNETLFGVLILLSIGVAIYMKVSKKTFKDIITMVKEAFNSG